MFFTLPILLKIKEIILWFISLFPEADITISNNIIAFYSTVRGGLVTWSAFFPINYMLFIARLHIAMLLIYLTIRFAKFVIKNLSLGHLGH